MKTISIRRLLATILAVSALLPCGALALPSYGSPPPLKGFVIGIDPGHQLQADNGLEQVSPGDSTLYKCRMSGGCTGVLSGVEEYEINRLVSVKLATLLQQAGATVVMTRMENDVSLSNRERAELMNQAEVDLWVRVHCNSSLFSDYRGAMALMPSVELDIHEESSRLGELVLSNFCDVTGAAGNSSCYTSTQTGFNWSDSPVATIEMGYLSNSEDDLLLCSDSYQSLCAQGIYEGIAEYCLGGLE